MTSHIKLRLLARSALAILILVFTGSVAYYLVSSSSNNLTEFSYKFGMVGEVNVKSPLQEARGMVILLSDSDGSGQRDRDVSDALAKLDFIVAVISLPEYKNKLNSRGGKCISLINSIDNLSKDVQHKTGMRNYMQPVVAGIGEGGAWAFAALRQSAAGMDTGAVSINFVPEFRSSLPLCNLKTSKNSRAPHWEIIPGQQVPAPWTVVNSSEQSPTAKSKAAKDFVRSVDNGKYITGTTTDPDFSPDVIMSAFENFLVPVNASSGSSMAILPLTEIQGANAPVTDTMAVFYSGDGGWTGLDQQIATEMAKQGVPTIGISSLKYFWGAQTPASSGKDLDMIIHEYGKKWHRKKVIIIGYSFGADILPFIYPALSPESQTKVTRLSLLGLSDSGDFQFHLGSWLDISGDSDMPTIPAIERIKGVDIQCIKGTTESGSACPDISQGDVNQVTLPGDHHFNDNAKLIAATFLRSLAL